VNPAQARTYRNVPGYPSSHQAFPTLQGGCQRYDRKCLGNSHSQSQLQRSVHV
jgi:hypothetical protein